MERGFKVSEATLRAQIIALATTQRRAAKAEKGSCSG